MALWWFRYFGERKSPVSIWSRIVGEQRCCSCRRRLKRRRVVVPFPINHGSDTMLDFFVDHGSWKTCHTTTTKVDRHLSLGNIEDYLRMQINLPTGARPLTSGKTMSLKFRIEELNDREKSLTLRIVEGDVLELYSNFTVKMAAADGGVTWYFEFEKNNESAPNPDAYSKLAAKLTKVVNLYLLNN